jgi:hypothetical protein
MSKLNPLVYEKAAELIELGEKDFARSAVIQSDNYKREHYLAFKELFSPYDEDTVVVWFGDYWKQNCRNERVTALLLMAEIARTEKI